MTESHERACFLSNLESVVSDPTNKLSQTACCDHSCSVRVKRTIRRVKIREFDELYNVNAFLVFFGEKFYVLLMNYQPKIAEIITVTIVVKKDSESAVDSEFPK